MTEFVGNRQNVDFSDFKIVLDKHRELPPQLNSSKCGITDVTIFQYLALPRGGTEFMIMDTAFNLDQELPFGTVKSSLR